MVTGIPTIIVYSRQEFRDWLQKHHLTEKKVCVVLHKKHTGKTSPSHREQIEEAICFGWIDTTVKRLDEDRYLRFFSKRTEKSMWSQNTLRYGKELLAAGLLFPEGKRYYKLGLKKKPHGFGIPKNPSMPDALKKALTKHTVAQRNFALFSPSIKRMFYRWILSGKQERTREKRIKKVVEKATLNDKTF
jgi:uncharacterized protein YdeI (YjbR/CyaY-like superfamily)